MERPHNSNWQVVTFNKPLLFTRDQEEVWMFNPKRRYILNANQLRNLQVPTDHIETISDLKGCSDYRPLSAGAHLPGSSILVERYRERGIGDLLFTTGPLNYLHHLAGGDLYVDYYALSSRGRVLTGNPVLAHKTALAGPLHLDDLRNYDYHWMIDTGTEYNEEADQLNVYDALFRQLGINPNTVDSKWKRPSAYLSTDDLKNFDQFLYYIHEERQVDLRSVPYYVVAPLSYGSLRVMDYRIWLEVINMLSQRRPVVVVGHLSDRLPATSMTVGEFSQRLDGMGEKVINVMGNTPERVMMSVIAGAKCVVCLDSAPLYIAQAFRTPAVSIWGTHDPGVRIGYDKDYMELAVWNRSACRFSPCFAYAKFPEKKCPNGANQDVCEPLATVNPDSIMEKVDMVESANLVIEPVAVSKG